jgi:acetoacetyl-CoA synthetase
LPFFFRFTDELTTRIKQEIRSKLSPRHIPAKILQTQDIPHTTNGKKVEVAVKRILAGENIEHRVAYRNPESLDLYHNLKELEDL